MFSLFDYPYWIVSSVYAHAIGLACQALSATPVSPVPVNRPTALCYFPGPTASLRESRC